VSARGSSVFDCGDGDPSRRERAYPITSAARSSSDSGILTPRVLAVFLLLAWAIATLLV